MAKSVSLLTSAACVAALAMAGTAAALAKQSCSVGPASRGYWSWRMIDGRKCWYEGKPMLSKSMLVWPTAAKTARETRPELPRAPEAKAGDPLDAQAYAPDDPATFEALWRDRIEKR